MYSNEEGLSIPVSDLSDADSMDSSAGKLMENAQLYVYYDEDDGLTVAVQSTKAQKIQLAGGLLETSVDVVTGATKKYTTKEFGMVKWGLLVASGLFETTSTPEVVAHPDRCIILAGEGEGAEFSFQWKKLLKNILLEQLLGE